CKEIANLPTRPLTIRLLSRTPDGLVGNIQTENIPPGSLPYQTGIMSKSAAWNQDASRTLNQILMIG
ncbi:hypothetical protein N9B47_01405, partial [bacterium]|nr:hypothetical protein [bacterium]